jgi:hypothetical protein
MKFKIGDVVKCIKLPIDNSELYGYVGTIRYIFYDEKVYSVEFDKEIFCGYNCGGCCKFGHGWNIKEECLALLEKKVIKPYPIVEFLKGINATV